MCSPKIFTAALLALTVPSLPSPKNTAVRAGSSRSRSSASTSACTGSERCVTSSTMPTVKPCSARLEVARSASAASPARASTAATIAGVNSFDDSP